MLELARARRVALPVDDADSLARFMLASDARGLPEYLERFRLTLAVMQDDEAIERIAYELAIDHAEENVRYVEARFSPVLNTEQGMRPHEVLEAALKGFARAERELAIRTGVIVCALRSLSPTISTEMAEVAVSLAGEGVCGFDLAGAEAGYPVRDHVEALETARDGGLPITIHAGEGFGPESIRQAIDLGGAQRIGHGTRLLEDRALLERVRDSSIPLEICLTSNVQTRAVASYAEHPLRYYFDEGVTVCLCTDNRLMSGVTLTDEYCHARDHLGFSWEELVAVARNGFTSAYASEEQKRYMLESFEEEVAAIT